MCGFIGWIAHFVLKGCILCLRVVPFGFDSLMQNLGGKSCFYIVKSLLDLPRLSIAGHTLSD